MKNILIIGNGPSTKELVNFGFRNIPNFFDTFGMGLSYKFFRRINWWPTYYACADIKVVTNTQKEFANLICNENIQTKKFYFPINIVSNDKLEVIQHGSTGDFCFKKAIDLGYKYIFIIGIDLDYEPIPEATPISRNEFNELDLDIDFDTNKIYKIRRPITNHPNYFFSDYQEVGDIYSEPRGNSWHLLTWWRARDIAAEKKLVVRNLGTLSQLEYFKKIELKEAFERKKFNCSFPRIKASSIAGKIFRTEKAISDQTAKELGTMVRENRRLLYSIEQMACGSIDKIIPNKENQSKFLISVIIPFYDSESFLDICLESLCHQTLPTNCYEIICVDDCSSDKTLSLLNEYANNYDNIHVIKQKSNLKQGAARNKGIDAAQGKYIIFVDSDDFLRIDALELLLNQAEGLDVLVFQHKHACYCKKFDFRNSIRKINSDIKKSVLNNNLGWWICGLLIKKSVLDKNNIRFREGVQFEDIDFVIRLSFCAEKYKMINDILYYYIQREGSTVNLISEQTIIDGVAAIDEVKRFLTFKDKKYLDVYSNRARDWLNLMVRRIIKFSSNDRERRKLVSLMWEQINSFSSLKMLRSGKFHLSAHKKNIENNKSEREKCNYDLKSDISGFKYLPWGDVYEDVFRDKVIIYCEVDYHIRNAAPIVRELKNKGIRCIIIDASESTCFTVNRPLKPEEAAEYSDIEILKVDVAKSQPCATSALSYIFMNDLTYTKNFIFELYGYGIPMIGFYEGINDDFNVDRIMLRRPYRSTHYLLLPGFYQSLIYNDRESYIIGLPNIRILLQEKYIPSSSKTVVINVNFTYGVLEECRDLYVSTAVQACSELGLNYVISQHPADKSDLQNYIVSTESIYTLIRNGAILISRFSTTILEALALGRPVVYHNPHQEKVDKFKQPMGAYSTSYDVISLKTAIIKELRFSATGGNIRNRSTAFLHLHANILSDGEPYKIAADAIQNILSKKKPISFKLNNDSINKKLTQPAVSDVCSEHVDNDSIIGNSHRFYSHNLEDSFNRKKLRQSVVHSTGGNEKLQFEIRDLLDPRDSLIVMGNGSSLSKIDHTKLNTTNKIGMNAAYRYWGSTGIYPDYYICLDTVVIETLKDEIYELIQKRFENGIQLFFLRKKLLNFYPELKNIPEVVFFEDYFNSSYFEGMTQGITTGSFAALLGAMLGYKRIYLLGIDLNYVQQIPEAKRIKGHVLEITQTPVKNPNYFFDDYQRKGDRFNVPDSTPDLHYQSWVMVKERLERFGVHVLNCNPDSRLDIFEYADINEVLPR